MTRSEMLDFANDLFDAVHATLTERNSKYGADEDAFSNINFSAEFAKVTPLQTVLVRFADKLGRLQALVDGRQLDYVDESMQDTLKDIIGYTTIIFALLYPNAFKTEDTPTPPANKTARNLFDALFRKELIAPTPNKENLVSGTVR